MLVVSAPPSCYAAQLVRTAQEVRGTPDLRGPEWNVDPRVTKLFYAISETKNSLWKPLRNYGKIVGKRVVTITYEGESLLWLLR